MKMMTFWRENSVNFFWQIKILTFATFDSYDIWQMRILTDAPFDSYDILQMQRLTNETFDRFKFWPVRHLTCVILQMRHLTCVILQMWHLTDATFDMRYLTDTTFDRRNIWHASVYRNNIWQMRHLTYFTFEFKFEIKNLFAFYKLRKPYFFARIDFVCFKCLVCYFFHQWNGWLFLSIKLHICHLSHFFIHATFDIFDTWQIQHFFRYMTHERCDIWQITNLTYFTFKFYFE